MASSKKNKKHWAPSKDVCYLACDGDATGSEVSSLIFAGDTEKAHKLSVLINVAGQAIVDHLKKAYKARNIIQGGDDIMVEIKANEWDDAITEHVRDIFHEFTGFTLSVGMGDTPTESSKSLVIAKDTGKDRTVYWSDNKETSYQSAVDSKVSELKMKLKAAGAGEK